jgi:hypothetical protein
MAMAMAIERAPAFTRKSHDMKRFNASSFTTALLKKKVT